MNTRFVIVGNGSVNNDCMPGISNYAQNIVYTLSNWGEPGEFIDSIFDGTIKDIDFNNYNISGVIHVIRDE